MGLRRRTEEIFVILHRLLYRYRLFMQIMECCYYLNHTNLDKNNGAKKEDDSNFVRLLTGSRALSGMVDITDVNVPKDKSAKQAQFSMSVVKKSTGLLIEHIVDFYGKWKDSTKSRG
ncbi:Protein smg5 [Sarracenia purpurea var. burkii]